MRNIAFGYYNYMHVFLSMIIFWVESLNKRNFAKFFLKLKNSLLTIKKSCYDFKVRGFTVVINQIKCMINKLNNH